jgi:outer membrane protein TolC
MRRLGIILLLSATISSVQAAPLTWTDCINLTKTNNRSLLIAQEKNNQAISSKISAQAGYWPQISASMGKTDSEQTMQDPKNTTKSTSYSYGLGVKQLIFDGWKTSSQIKSAELAIESAAYAYTIVEANVRFNVRSAFVTLLKAQEQLALTKKIQSRRQQNVQLIQMRYEAGREHKGSLLLAQAQVAQATTEVSQAERAQKIAAEQLRRQIGIPTLDITAVTENEVLPPPTAEPLFTEMAEANPTLKQIITEIDTAKATAETIRADQLPAIYASYQNGKSGKDWPPENSQWSLGLNMSFTVFDGNRNGAGTDKAASAIQQAQLEAMDGRETVLYTLQESWMNYQNAIDNLLVQEKFMSAAEERAKISTAQYSTGLIDFDAWTIIEDNLVSTKKNQVQARAAVLLAEAQWRQAQGGGFEHD